LIFSYKTNSYSKLVFDRIINEDRHYSDTIIIGFDPIYTSKSIIKQNEKVISLITRFLIDVLEMKINTNLILREELLDLTFFDFSNHYSSKIISKFINIIKNKGVLK